MGYLRDARLRRRLGRGLRRSAVFIGLVSVTAGAAVLTAAPALAVKDTESGHLGLFPSIGSATWTPLWYTQHGCPAGFQGSAVLYELNTDGSIARSISPIVAHVRARFAGTLLGPVGQLITHGSDVRDGGTSEWVVGCFAGPGGKGDVEYVQSTDVTLSTDGSIYWTGTPRRVATTTTLTASPNPAAAGATVALTATVSAADAAIPPGYVAFSAGDTLISVAPLNARGAATATTMFAAEGTQPRQVSLSAYYLGSPGFSGSTASYRETVNPAQTQTGDSESITFIIPASGTFTVTITPGTVILTAPNRRFAKGRLQDITVTDTRRDHPGWSVSGQESDFAGSGIATGQTIAGNQLGWTPVVVPRMRGVTPGPEVDPADPGLGTTAAILALAEEGHGFGSYALTALVVLVIPPTTPGGPYTGNLTITAVEAGPLAAPPGRSVHAPCEGDPMPLELINPPGLPVPATYSQVAVATGSNLMFIAGQEPEDAQGHLVGPGDLAAQARQVFANLGVALAAAGARPGQVAKITIYVVHHRPEYLPVIEAARVTLFGDHKPPDTVVGVETLSRPEYLIEVDAIAVLGA